MDYELNNPEGKLSPYHLFVANELRKILIQRWGVLKDEIEKEEKEKNAFTVFSLEKEVPKGDYINFSIPLKKKMHESLKDANLDYLVQQILQKWNSLNS